MDITKLLHLSKQIADEFSGSFSNEKLNNMIHNTNQEDIDFIVTKIKDYMTNTNYINDNNSNKDKNKNKYKYKYKKNRSKKSQSLCVVCLVNKSNTSFIHGDTAHLCCCQECSINFDSNDNCPICRKKIDNKVKTY
jgi:hypothetical protein